MSDYGSQAPGGMPPAASGGSPPPSHLVWAILSTFLCCLPLGIVSIVFAAQVNSKYAAGDYAGAVDSSAKAKRFAIFAAIGGVVVGVLYGLAIAAGVFSLDTAP